MSADITVVRGEPSDEELAALAAVLLLRQPAAPPAPAPRSRWAPLGRPGYAPRTWRDSARIPRARWSSRNR